MCIKCKVIEIVWKDKCVHVTKKMFFDFCVGDSRFRAE